MATRGDIKVNKHPKITLGWEDIYSHHTLTIWGDKIPEDLKFYKKSDTKL